MKKRNLIIAILATFCQVSIIFLGTQVAQTQVQRQLPVMPCYYSEETLYEDVQPGPAGGIRVTYDTTPTELTTFKEVVIVINPLESDIDVIVGFTIAGGALQGGRPVESFTILYPGSFERRVYSVWGDEMFVWLRPITTITDIVVSVFMTS